jgi:hypothetical protein
MDPLHTAYDTGNRADQDIYISQSSKSEIFRKLIATIPATLA